MSRSPTFIASISILLLSLAGTPGCSGSSAAQAPVPPPAGEAVEATDPVVRALPDFAQLVDLYGRSVINIDVTRKTQLDTSSAGAPQNDPFYEFFRRFGIPGPNLGPRGFQQQQPARAEGSGFIVTPDGYILTNAHVVAQADTVTVRLTDRREFQAKVIGSDERTDVAVIKIDARALPAVKIGQPTQLRPGEWVLAIGSPFGFENRVTAGIVSATARSLPNGNVPFIQTDVAVNPGNSGGPLFNLRGEVIGINSQIFSRTGGYMGLSFAIPIDVAMNVQEQLIKTGRVVRGRIGVAVQDLNAQLAESFKLDRPRGALVSSVEKDSPAEKAGIKPGDIILAVDGRPISRYGDLSLIIAGTRPGSDARLEVWRGGESKTLSVRVAELKEPSLLKAKAEGESAEDEAGRLGLAVRPLTAQEKAQTQTQGSLVVEEVTGPAAAAGVQPGDIVLGVNGRKVRSIGELRSVTKSSKKTVALLIQREDAQIFVPVQMG